jgi:acetylornithine aminotransferase
LEPGSSSGFVRFPPEKLIRRIVDKVKESNGFVLVNEVTTGIGRTGEWFGFQHYGISPDIVAMGKGIGNGYPISVTAFAPGVIERLGGVPVPYAQSHQNDALGAAVARRVIGVIREHGLIERSREIARLLMTGLAQIMSRTGKIEEIRGRGLMAAVDLADDAEGSFTARAHRELVRRGFVLARRPGSNTLRLDPALTIQREDIEDFLGALEEVLTQPSTHRDESGAKPAGRA